MAARWGQFVYTRRWVVLAASLLLFALSIGLIVRGGTLKNATNINAKSVTGLNLEGQQLASANQGTTLQFVATDPALSARSPQFEQAVNAAFRRIGEDTRTTSVETPYNTDATNAPQLLSDTDHSILVNVNTKLDFATARQEYSELRAKVSSPVLTIYGTGLAALAAGIDSATEADLRLGEALSLPLALVVLVLVFGSGVSALLCLAVGVFAVSGGI